jgi:hypothetical protein
MKKNSISIIKRATLHTLIFFICLLAGVSLGHVAKDTIGSTATIVTLIFLTFPTMFLASQGILYDNVLEKSIRSPLMKLLAAFIFPIGLIVTIGIAADTNLGIASKLLLGLIASGIIGYDIMSVLDISEDKIPKLTSFIPSNLKAFFAKEKHEVIEGKYKEITEVKEQPKEEQDRIKLLKADLDQFIKLCPSIKPQLERAKSDILELQIIRMSLDRLKERAYKAALLEQLENSYSVVNKGVLQNIDDIITICVAGQADFNAGLKEDELQDVEQELKDNRHKLDKMKEILSIVGRSATQRTTDMSNIGIDATATAISNFLDNNSPSLGTK